MTNISHEEMGDSCDSCGLSEFMCDCLECEKCKETYDPRDLQYGMCPDCFYNFDKKDLEDKLEEIL